jgi:two-component system chemotaxis sensor kinase CheA
MSMEDEILKDFLAESKENLESLDQEFVELEQEPENAELIKSIFRTIHTIKGTSGFFGFTTLEGTAHFAEDILSKLRDGVVAVDEEITTVLLQAVDHIKAILAALEQTAKEPDDIAYVDFIVDLRNFAEKIVKAGRAQKPAHHAQAEATPESSETASDGSEVEEAPEETTAGKELPGRADEERAGKGIVHKDHAGGAANKEKQEPAAVRKPRERAQSSQASVSPTATGQLSETHVRVYVHLLDQLMNLAGELVLSRNRLVQIAGQIDSPDLLAANQRNSLIVTELQEQIMKTRMQPIGYVFNKFPRVVRDLAKNAQKQVQLQIEGAETELDRSIIETIKDPLTHMVRNSIDHGIEAPDLRVKKGKPSLGTMTMRAYHEGGQVIIEIQDDGAGIDAAKIRRKSVEKGLISAEQAEGLSDREALMLVFQPGFSTAEKVTNISGRGVGMDVVRANIEKLGGIVDLQSEVDLGTTVKIKIPLTLAIIPALIVHGAGQYYAIPQVNLVELVHLSREALARDVQIIGASEFYRLRGQILPLIRLRDVLGYPPKESAGDGINIVVLNSGDRHFGLVVDAISDSEEIVVKPLGRHLKHMSCYAGTTLMGDGKAALILDVLGITTKLELKGEESVEHTKVLSAEAAAQEERQFLLLFRIGEELFALPLAVVNRLDKIPASRIETIGGREVIQYRGQSMPIIRLDRFLPVSPLPEQEEYHLIVFHMSSKNIALLVSQIEDSLDVAVDVEENTLTQDGIFGSAIMKEKTTLFLDIYRLINMYDRNFFDSQGYEKADAKRILLAEDSTFYRNLLRSYLVSAGYRVAMAKDGLDAWEQLQTSHFDLVITDMEMPRMNGYELTRKIRGETRFKDMPVIAVTSLDGDDDKRRGIQAGVNDYQAKLDRDMVLAAVNSLLNTKDLQNAA